MYFYLFFTTTTTTTAIATTQNDGAIANFISICSQIYDDDTNNNIFLYQSINQG